MKRLLYTTARLQKFQRKYKTGADAYQEMVLPEEVTHAQDTWIKQVQRELHVEIKNGKHRELVSTVEDGIILVGGHAERWLDSTWNRQKFVLLPRKHHFSRLIAEQEHVNVGHLALESTIAKIRAKYWIIGVRKIVK